MKTALSLAAIGVTILAVQFPSTAANFTAKVVSVGDGDTITIGYNGKKKTVRLACIDAPETRQKPWGQRSTAKLKGLLPGGQRVKIRQVTIDRYGRTVGEVYVGNRSINLAMVQAGEAVVYRQYLDACRDTKSLYLKAEQQAKKRRLGYWNQRNPIMPSTFRRQGRRSNSSPRRTQGTMSTQGYVAGTCKELRRMGLSRFTPGDPNYTRGRDRDNDGIACE
ncbi:thermonuclease family protein [filamentous cyanobacterium LEGE 11480]|uniref:Thermonuclease family protein n=1 Tax=Romeriopsis navalis LEGE 11480 TaxID=2777977 RepID=A0A928VSM9_9CYAN|nr:thermonuclease family protein [Romeriopsis navalis]MBE9031807.1 thermonuclease family protein [Romeriopsis navalis LEGE 11480]